MNDEERGESATGEEPSDQPKSVSNREDQDSVVRITQDQAKSARATTDDNTGGEEGETVTTSEPNPTMQ